MRTPAPLARLFVASALLIGLLLMSACSSTPDQPAEQTTAVFTFSAESYPAVHAAAVKVLRDNGFTIARNDYRFGAVTSDPKESPTLMEFWLDDATTRDQAQSDTLNAQQRTVRVTIQEYVDLEAALSSTNSDGGEGTDDTPKQYQLMIEVLVERLQQPDRYLTHSASNRLTATYRTTPRHLNNRGIDGTYAQVMTRDPLLERRLVQAIHQAVAAE